MLASMPTFIIVFMGVSITLTVLWAIVFLYYDHKTGTVTAETWPAMRARMVALLKEHKQSMSALSPINPYNIVDLGSGNGVLCWTIAKALPDARVIGIELSPVPFLQSLIRNWIKRLPNLSYRRADFRTIPLNDVSAVVLYLTRRAIVVSDVGIKLDRELPRNALVLSKAFPLPEPWVPERVETLPPPFPAAMKLYVYRKSSEKSLR